MKSPIGTRDILYRAALLLLITLATSLSVQMGKLHADDTNIFVRFQNFDSVAGLQLNGRAARVKTDKGNVLRLVPAIPDARGSVFSRTTVNASSFSTAFAFQFTEPDGSGGGADGFVFVVQSVGSGVGTSGGGLGYAGLERSVGVEFDIYSNPENGADINDSHTAINVGGGFGLAAPKDNTAPVTPNMKDGTRRFAWVDYNGTTIEVRVSTNGVRPSKALAKRTVNIPAELHSDRGFVGFTASTGGGWANHDILAWQYNSEFAPIQNPTVARNIQPTLDPIDNLVITNGPGTAEVQLTGIGSGSPTEKQLLSLTAISSDTSLIDVSSLNYVTSNSTGHLELASKPGAAGTAIVSVSVHDNGGTDNGGIDSRTRTFQVTVVKANTPPRVEIDSPKPESTSILGAQILVSAKASDLEGPVASVEFFADSTPLKKVTETPFAFLWANATVGPHQLTAKATDIEGLQTISIPVRIQVIPPPPKPPIVSLYRPVNGAIYTAGETIELSAEASDPDKDLQRVEFYAGPNRLGTVFTPPFLLSWTNTTPISNLEITAQAVDRTELRTISSPAIITIAKKANLPPLVSITSPSNGQAFQLGYTVPIEIEASDTDGDIALLELLEIYGETTNVVTTFSAPPFRHTLSLKRDGILSLVARATDDQGLTTLSPQIQFRVDSFNGDILLIGDALQPEIQAIQRYLAEFAIFPNGDGTRRSSSVQILPSNSLTAEVANAFRIVIWNDAGSIHGPSPSAVRALDSIKRSAKPIYFIGEQLTDVAALDPITSKLWVELTQTMSTGTILPIPILIEPADPADRPAELFSGLAGFVSSFTYPNSPATVMITKSLGEIRARAGTSDLLIRTPSYSSTTETPYRSLTQHFLVTPGEDEASLEERRKLFLNSIIWLMRLNECESFGLSLVCDPLQWTQSVGDRFTVLSTVFTSGRCPAIDVSFVPKLQPGLRIVNLTATNISTGSVEGLVQFVDQTAVLRFRVLEAPQGIAVSTQIEVVQSGTYTNEFVVQSIYGLNESQTFTVEIVGPDCSPPKLRISSSSKGWTVHVSAQPGCTIIMEQSYDLLHWDSAGTPIQIKEENQLILQGSRNTERSQFLRVRLL